MAKTFKQTIKFTPTDYKPKRLASGLIGFRAPLDISIPVGGTIVVDLKTKADQPLLFGKGVEAKMVEPGDDILVKITNDMQIPMALQAGTIVARGYPLFNQDFEIE